MVKEIDLEVSKDGGLTMGVMVSFMIFPFVGLALFTSHWIVAILLLPIAIGAFISKKGFGLSLNKDHNQYRFYNQIGIWKNGEWKKVHKPDFLTMKSVLQVEGLYKEHAYNKHGSIEREVFKVYLNFNHQKKGLKVITTYSEKKATKILQRLHEELNVPIKKMEH